MSVRIMSLVFENQSLSSTEKLVLLALADHANDEGRSIYPSNNRISLKTALARGTVNRVIQSLCNAGYLTKVAYLTDRNNVVEYSINVTKLSSSMTSGVTESDTQVSSSVTRGVTQGDTNHHLTTIINHHNNNEQPPLFYACLEVYKNLKGDFPEKFLPAFSKMITEFIDNGVTASDFQAAIIAQSSDLRYNSDTPTAFKKWSIRIAKKRRSSKSFKAQDPDFFRRSWLKTG